LLFTEIEVEGTAVADPMEERLEFRGRRLS
jgi:hypothetical protein